MWGGLGFFWGGGIPDGISIIPKEQSNNELCVSTFCMLTLAPGVFILTSRILRILFCVVVYPCCWSSLFDFIYITSSHISLLTELLVIYRQFPGGLSLEVAVRFLLHNMLSGPVLLKPLLLFLLEASFSFGEGGKA